MSMLRGLTALAVGLAAHAEMEAVLAASVSGHGTPAVRQGAKVGRNDPCPCGCGKKAKKCPSWAERT
jgi:preprotein translocase subunit SecA